MSFLFSRAAVAALIVGAAASAAAQSPRVLHNFETSDEDWFADFNTDGTAAVVDAVNSSIAATSGALTWETTGPNVAVINGRGQGPNSFYAPNGPAVDLTGLSAMEFDLGVTAPAGGDATVDVQFFIRSVGPTDPNGTETYASLGTFSIPTDGVVRTYSGDLFNTVDFPMTALERSFARQIGLFIFNHGASGTYSWELGEVRTSGTAQTERVLADFTPEAGSFDPLDSAAVAFQNDTVVGGGGGLSNDGLSRVDPAGTDGALEFQMQFADDSEDGGPAIIVGNGLISADVGSGFFTRALDLSSYNFIEFDIAINGTLASNPTSASFVYQGDSFAFEPAGAPNQEIIPNSGFQTVSFPLADVTSGTGYLYHAGIILSEPAPGDGVVTVQIDEVRAVTNATAVEDWMWY